MLFTSNTYAINWSLEYYLYESTSDNRCSFPQSIVMTQTVDKEQFRYFSLSLSGMLPIIVTNEIVVSSPMQVNSPPILSLISCFC